MDGGEAGDDGGRADASAPKPTLGDQNQSRREVTLYLLLREHQPANSFSRHRFQRSCSPKQLPASAQADQIEDFCAAWASHSAPTHPPAAFPRLGARGSLVRAYTRERRGRPLLRT
jgi:hypothetical protein